MKDGIEKAERKIVAHKNLPSYLGKKTPLRHTQKQFVNTIFYKYVVCICICVCVCIYKYTHTYIGTHTHMHTANTLSNILVARTIHDNCAMENKHLLYYVSSIVFEYKGQHIIADNFDSNNNDCRPCQYSLCY